MFNIVLYQPEIPPNTGNIIRLCANTGAQLILIKPMAFELDDKKLVRAGLDYHEWANVKIYENFSHFWNDFEKSQARLFAFEPQGETCYSAISYQSGDFLMFGPETRGLPSTILNELPRDHIVRLPMLENSRSLNLSNSVAVALYEAWRQNGFSYGR